MYADDAKYSPELPYNEFSLTTPRDDFCVTYSTTPTAPVPNKRNKFYSHVTRAELPLSKRIQINYFKRRQARDEDTAARTCHLVPLNFLTVCIVDTKTVVVHEKEVMYNPKTQTAELALRQWCKNNTDDQNHFAEYALNVPTNIYCYLCSNRSCNGIQCYRVVFKKVVTQNVQDPSIQNVTVESLTLLDWLTGYNKLNVCDETCS